MRRHAVLVAWLRCMRHADRRSEHFVIGQYARPPHRLSGLHPGLSGQWYGSRLLLGDWGRHIR